MKYIIDSQKSFQEVVDAVHTNVPKHKFGILHVHDIKATLNGKGVHFENAVNVFEVCNPHVANTVLREDISLNMALPCRISVWVENGTTKLGMLTPTALIGQLNDSDELAAIAQEVEETLMKILNESK